MTRRGVCTSPLVLVGLIASLPAMAQGAWIDLPSGTLGAAVDALAHRNGVTVVLAEPALWTRPVRAVRGRMTISAAVRELASQAGAQAKPVGASGWRLVPFSKLQSLTPTNRTVRGAHPIFPREPAVPDIVVLASKRTVSRSDFAGSVTMVELPSLGLDAGTSALIARSTIVSSTYRGAGREKLFIRGISDSSFSGRLQSVTGMYLGEVRLTYDASDPDLQLYDIGSVEVLQGPQGTLYGSGSLAGIIRLNPNPPVRNVISASGGLGLSSVSRGGTGGDVDAVLNVPMGPDAAIRVVGYDRSDAGYIDRPTLGADVNRTRITGGRITARWWSGNGWTVDVIGMAQRIRTRDSHYASVGAEPLTNLGTIAEPFSGTYLAGHFVVHGRLGGLDLTSATGVARQRFDERFEAQVPRLPFAVLPFALVDVDRSHGLLTHETRFSRVGSHGAGWVGGVAYTFTDRTSKDRRRFGPFESGLGLHGTVSDAAVFGEGTVRVAPFLMLGGGARVAQAISTARYEEMNVSRAVTAAPRRRQRWLLPTASLLLQAEADASVYMRYQQGRRPAPPASPEFEAAESMGGETIDVLDGGVRWAPADGWRASVSVEHSRWRKLPIDIFEGFFGFWTGNLGDWSNISANISMDGPLLPDLKVDAALTVNHARPLSPTPGAPDIRLPDVAGVIARIGATWTYRLSDAWEARVDGWVRYEGASTAVLPGVFQGKQGDYVQTRLALDLNGASAGLSLSVDNVLDTRGTRYLLGSIGRPTSVVTPLRPRTVRIGLRRTF